MKHKFILRLLLFTVITTRDKSLKKRIWIRYVYTKKVISNETPITKVDRGQERLRSLLNKHIQWLAVAHPRAEA